MRVLVACEFSGVVRRAFRASGHDAWSCDLLPAEDGEQEFHLTGDVLNYLDPAKAFDLMIAHPPCTYLANSGVRWLDTQPGRRNKMRDAAAFFIKLQRCNIPRIAIENPIPHKHAKQWIGKYSQLIQPWQFGHGETKATCLWCKNLPPLRPTKIVDGRAPRVHYVSPGPDRWKERSRTLHGIAEAMADQWGT
jgi:hypothetical protein